MKTQRWSWFCFWVVLLVAVIALLIHRYSAPAAGLTLLGGVLGLEQPDRRKADNSLPKPTVEEQVREALKNLVPGRIIFDVPEEMKFGHSKFATTKIAKELSDEEKARVANLKPTAKDEIKTGTFMTVKLSGGEAFEILRLSQDSQPILDEGWTTWQWKITPKKAGRQSLEISVAVRLKLENSEETLSLPAYSQIIYVERDLWHTTFWFLKLSGEVFIKNFKEICSALGVPLLFVYLFKHFGW